MRYLFHDRGRKYSYFTFDILLNKWFCVFCSFAKIRISNFSYTNFLFYELTFKNALMNICRCSILLDWPQITMRQLQGRRNRSPSISLLKCIKFPIYSKWTQENIKIQEFCTADMVKIYLEYSFLLKTTWKLYKQRVLDTMVKKPPPTHH